MAASNTPLADLWVNDGGAPVTTQAILTTPLKGNGSDLKDVVTFYKDSGLDSVAKEVGLLDANGELAGFRQEVNPQQKQTIQMIAVPVHSSQAQMQQQSTPRTIRVASTTVSASPVQIISAQNLLQATQVMGPRGTPQLIATPIHHTQAPSPQTWGSAGGPRKRVSQDFTEDFESKRRKGEKGGKGLRHFSMKVCEKVQRKGSTSYNEVADELVSEFTDPRNANMSDQAYDQKNIRRRVYDALNVLMAMNIISKEKKEIKWIGLPTNSAQECQNLEMEKTRRVERIKLKTQQLQELILQQIAFKNLVERNRQLEQSQGAPTSNSAIQLPFIIVNTSKKTVIDCSISSDKCEYLFNFNNTFEIHDDIEVLKRMGMAYGLEKGQCSQNDLCRAIKMVPRSLEPYVTKLAKGNSLVPIPMSLVQDSYIPQTSRPLLQEALAGPSHEQSLDHEVAMATGYAMSRQSSVCSFSRESPEDGYSDENESERSSPVDLH